MNDQRQQDLAKWQEIRRDTIEAMHALARGGAQSYSIGGRQLQHVDLDKLKALLKIADEKIEALGGAPSSKPRSVFSRVTVVDA